jgi:hypothetical protein
MHAHCIIYYKYLLLKIHYQSIKELIRTEFNNIIILIFYQYFQSGLGDFQRFGCVTITSIKYHYVNGNGV